MSAANVRARHRSRHRGHHRHLPAGRAAGHGKLRAGAAGRGRDAAPLQGDHGRPAIPISSPSWTAASRAMPTPVPIARARPIASRWRIRSTSRRTRRAKASAALLLEALIDASTAKGYRLMVAVIGDSRQFRLDHPAPQRRLHVLRHHPLGRLQVRPLARQRHHGAAARRGRQARRRSETRTLNVRSGGAQTPTPPRAARSSPGRPAPWPRSWPRFRIRPVAVTTL